MPRTFVVALVLLCSAASRAEDVTVVEVSYENCGSGTAAFIKGEVCHVQDLKKQSGKFVFTMKVGLFAEAAIPGVGAGVRSAFVVKVSVPTSVANSEGAVQKYVKEHPEDLAKKIVASLSGKPKAPSEQEVIRLLKQNACQAPVDQLKELLKKNACSLDG